MFGCENIDIEKEPFEIALENRKLLFKPLLDLLKKDILNSNDTLQDIYDLFSSKPFFNHFDDPRTQAQECVKFIEEFCIKLSQLGLFNLRRLLMDAFMIVSRNEENKIIPVDFDVEKRTDDFGDTTIFIRCGQLIEQNEKRMVHGIGRQINLMPKYDAKVKNIIGFYESNIWEG